MCVCILSLSSDLLLFLLPFYHGSKPWGFKLTSSKWPLVILYKTRTVESSNTFSQFADISLLISFLLFAQVICIFDLDMWKIIFRYHFFKTRGRNLPFQSSTFKILCKEKTLLASGMNLQSSLAMILRNPKAL